MTAMKALAFCLLLAVSQELSAQTYSFDVWHKGKVVVAGWDTLRGLIKYGSESTLQLMRDGNIETYDAEKVVSFEIQDESYKRTRQFYSLRYGAAEANKYFFFELLSYGKVTVLSREAIEIKTLSQGTDMAPPKKHHVLVEKYFLWDKRNAVASFRGRPKDWNELLVERISDVNGYIKQRRLNLRNKYDVKQIIDFYNSFFNP
ncbi:MAG TPA: hypothetical protein VL728_09660 [Cyclobacteriaceae bacterium]|jgi:hypothetical protein|nr:hypothetical protein [Cyclobacteriaceae bacterium]